MGGRGCSWSHGAGRTGGRQGSPEPGAPGSGPPRLPSRRRRSSTTSCCPYAERLDAESDLQLAQIKSNLGRAVQLQELWPGGLFWTRKLPRGCARVCRMGRRQRLDEGVHTGGGSFVRPRTSGPISRLCLGSGVPRQ